MTMPIIIDRTAQDNYWLGDFNKTFIDQLYLYMSDVTFTDSDKRLRWGAQDSTVNDWVYLPNIDIFNSLAVDMDLDLILSTELLRTYNSTFQRLLYYQVNVDFHPIRTSWYGMQYMNVLLNLQEGLNSTDETLVYFGLEKYADQPFFTLANMPLSEPISCVLWTKPVARKFDSDRANLLRQTIDFVFLVMLDKNIQVCGVSP